MGVELTSTYIFELNTISQETQLQQALSLCPGYVPEKVGINKKNL